MPARLVCLAIFCCGLVPVGSAQGKVVQPMPPVAELLEKLQVTIEDLGTFDNYSGWNDQRQTHVLRVRRIDKTELILESRSHPFGKPMDESLIFVHKIAWANIKSLKVTKATTASSFACELTLRKPVMRRLEKWPPPLDGNVVMEDTALPINPQTGRRDSTWVPGIRFAKRAEANLFRDQLVALLKRLGHKLDEIK